MPGTSYISIAIADDNPVTVVGVRCIANSSANCKVIIEAYDGESLLQQLTEASQLPDICFLDINMPGLNGYEVLAIIKDKWPGIRVIIFSMYHEDTNIRAAFALKASSYLSKKARPTELRNAIYEVHEHGIYINKWMPRDILYRIKDEDIITDMEMKVLKLCPTDMTYDEMAKHIGRSTRTIHGYRDSLFRKLNVHNRRALALFAMKCGLVPFSDSLPPEED